jgi:hypothetical protein
LQVSWLIRDKSVFMPTVLLLCTGVGVAVVLIIHFCVPRPSDIIIASILCSFMLLLAITTGYGLVRGTLVSQASAFYYA